MSWNNPTGAHVYSYLNQIAVEFWSSGSPASNLKPIVEAFSIAKVHVFVVRLAFTASTHNTTLTQVVIIMKAPAEDWRWKVLFSQFSAN